MTGLALTYDITTGARTEGWGQDAPAPRGRCGCRSCGAGPEGRRA